MYSVRLPLQVNANIRPVMEKRFHILAHISNQTRKRVKRLLSKLKHDELYQKMLQEYIQLKKLNSEDKKTEADIRRLKKALNETREAIGLTKSGLEAYAAVMQRRYKKNLSSHQVQAEVSHIWRGVEAVLFGDGSDIHYKKERDFRTIPGKSAKNGAVIHFDENENERRVDCYVTWNKLTIPVKYDIAKIDMTDGKNYLNEALSAGPIKYCEIERLWFHSGYKYYVVLYIDGTAPKKITPGSSTMGLDEGPSTVAAVSETAVFLEELAPKCKQYNKQIARLQRQIDRSVRQSNPDKYNPDGTCKKKTECQNRNWTFSKACLRKRAKLRELYRKKSDYTKCQHETLLNKMIQAASVFVNEPMEFKALAKRSKQTKRQEKPSEITKADRTKKLVHKYKRKKRFGKSINDRSPGLLKERLKQKCTQYGLLYLETDKWNYRASQYRHDHDNYQKTALSERFKIIAGCIVQRDLYSGFLQSCMETPEKPDRNKCIKQFDNFVKMKEALITNMKESGKSFPSCFGF